MKEAGIRVVDADRLVAELYRPGGDGAAAVARLFGREYLNDDGSVDHTQLAARVFTDHEALRRLEGALHPLVKRDFEAIARESTGVIVLEAPLLVEAGFASSTSDARRLLDQGGVRVDGTIITDVSSTLSSSSTGEPLLIQVGKRRFKKVTIVDE